MLRVETNTVYATVAARAHSHRVRGTASGAQGCPGALLRCRRAWRGRGSHAPAPTSDETVSSPHAVAAQRRAGHAEQALARGVLPRLRWQARCTRA